MMEEQEEALQVTLDQLIQIAFTAQDAQPEDSRLSGEGTQSRRAAGALAILTMASTKLVAMESRNVAHFALGLEAAMRGVASVGPKMWTLMKKDAPRG